MCDYYYWQRMENNYQGELSDIIRATSNGVVLQQPSSSIDFPMISISTDQWQQQLPSDPFSFSASNSTDFGDPFIHFGDPFLHELTGAQLFKSGVEAMTSGLPEKYMESGGGVGVLEKKVELGGDEEGKDHGDKKPCNNDNINLYSKVLQISGDGVKPRPKMMSLRAIKPSPVVVGEMMKVSSSGSSMMESGVQIISSPGTPGIKRRKNQAKKVVCVPAPTTASNRPTTGEIVPSDLWAWRKYGQKPIKGSPYPRGYYRCSSSKGCSARKQVERSRADPNMLVITYTSEHNHPWPTQRSALAGSTRSHTSKNTSKSSSNNLKSSSTEPKEETVETTALSAPSQKEEVTDMDNTLSPDENTEFNQVFEHANYKPIIPESCQPEDFFADLTELNDDPMSLIFSKEFEETKQNADRTEKGMGSFTMFDWPGSSI